MKTHQICIDENWPPTHPTVGNRLQFSILISVLITATFLQSNKVDAMTQFYIALPDAIQVLDGVTLSVEIPDYENLPVISWTHNGSKFVPDNNTMATKPNYDHLDLDNNDFLLAIKDNISIGTRLYICADIPYPIEQYDCQWNAVDKDHTAYAEFNFYVQAHKDSKVTD